MTPSWVEPGVGYDPCTAGDHPSCPDNIDDMNTCTCPCHSGAWVREEKEDQVGEVVKMAEVKAEPKGGMSGIVLYRGSTPKSCDPCNSTKQHDHNFVIALMEGGERFEIALCPEHLYKSLLAKAITLFEEDREAKRIDYILTRRKG